MDGAGLVQVYKLGDLSTSDLTVCLNVGEKKEFLKCHSVILSNKSKFFSGQLSKNNAKAKDYIEIQCPFTEYDYFVRLLRLLYFPEESLLDSLESVKCALGILRASISLQCELVTKTCVQYLEAVPWDEKDEEEILNLVPKLGPDSSTLLYRMKLPSVSAAKDVFLSAFRFASSLENLVPPFLDELKTSAQQQVEYMLLEDEDTPIVTLDEDVRLEIQKGLTKLLAEFHGTLSLLALESSSLMENSESAVLRSLVDVEWISNLLGKIGMMKHFVFGWIQISSGILAAIQEDKCSSCLWPVKLKLLELTGKAFEAIGYGSVVVPTSCRIRFLNTWLPYIRRTKQLLDFKIEEDETFPFKLDDDLCQSIEGAIVSLILALPSTDQACILTEWMNNPEHLRYPDLTEAFELWCYRAKSAKRRLAACTNGFSSSTAGGL